MRLSPPSMTADWPFEDPPNVIAFTTRYVLEGEPICSAYREWEDSSWQFLPDRITLMRDAKLVCLKEIFALDASIAELADLPPGWMATRADRTSPWQRLRNHPYPVFASDGFYLEDATAYERHYPDIYRIPPQQVRENLKVGDVTKLIFRFAEEGAPRKDNDAERMWVEVSEVDEDNGRYRGSLANDPEIHSAIAYGHEFWFHPLHIFAVAEPTGR